MRQWQAWPLNGLLISVPFFINQSILSSNVSGCIETFLVLLTKAAMVIESALFCHAYIRSRSNYVFYRSHDNVIWIYKWHRKY